LRRFKLELKKDVSGGDDVLNMISKDSKDSDEVISPYFGKSDTD